jgi:hypothetical protein
MLNGIMLSVVMLKVIMLSFVILNINILSVLVPKKGREKEMRGRKKGLKKQEKDWMQGILTEREGSVQLTSL